MSYELFRKDGVFLFWQGWRYGSSWPCPAMKEGEQESAPGTRGTLIVNGSVSLELRFGIVWLKT
ncbi:MAG TPA: hypothetical protein PLJ62_09340, partial [Thermoflexales bacterium]|nr:hypothetical protein [Thermoflexales bacterium]